MEKAVNGVTSHCVLTCHQSPLQVNVSKTEFLMFTAESVPPTASPISQGNLSTQVLGPEAWPHPRSLLTPSHSVPLAVLQTHPGPPSVLMTSISGRTTETKCRSICGAGGWAGRREVGSCYTKLISKEALSLTLPPAHVRGAISPPSCSIFLCVCKFAFLLLQVIPNVVFFFFFTS